MTIVIPLWRAFEKPLAKRFVVLTFVLRLTRILMAYLQAGMAEWLDHLPLVQRV